MFPHFSTSCQKRRLPKGRAFLLSCLPLSSCGMNRVQIRLQLLGDRPRLLKLLSAARVAAAHSMPAVCSRRASWSLWASPLHFCCYELLRVATRLAHISFQPPSLPNEWCVRLFERLVCEMLLGSKVDAACETVLTTSHATENETMLWKCGRHLGCLWLGIGGHQPLGHGTHRSTASSAEYWHISFLCVCAGMVPASTSFLREQADRSNPICCFLTKPIRGFESA